MIASYQLRAEQAGALAQVGVGLRISLAHGLPVNIHTYQRGRIPGVLADDCIVCIAVVVFHNAAQRPCKIHVFAVASQVLRHFFYYPVRSFFYLFKPAQAFFHAAVVVFIGGMAKKHVYAASLAAPLRRRKDVLRVLIGNALEYAPVPSVLLIIGAFVNVFQIPAVFELLHIHRRFDLGVDRPVRFVHEAVEERRFVAVVVMRIVGELQPRAIDAEAFEQFCYCFAVLFQIFRAGLKNSESAVKVFAPDEIPVVGKGQGSGVARLCSLTVIFELVHVGALPDLAAVVVFQLFALHIYGLACYKKRYLLRESYLLLHRKAFEIALAFVVIHHEMLLRAFVNVCADSLFITIVLFFFRRGKIR